MKNIFRPAARFVVINDQNEILLVQHEKHWAIPGWWIDFWENIFDAIFRESEEELGIWAQADKLIFLQDYTGERKWKRTHFMEYFWTIKNNKDFINVKKTYLEATHAFEIRDVEFFKIEDFPANFMPKAFMEVCKSYIKNKENFWVKYIPWTNK